MKQFVKSLPGVGNIAKHIYRTLVKKPKPFTNSTDYWASRYDAGGNSGVGSYNDLAEFKAEILNEFIRTHEEIHSVIEYGCGDGNQLKIAKYPSYIGFDVSPKAVSICRTNFSGDATKSFKLVEDYADEKADLTLSLDVVYHLVEDSVFAEYMKRLFSSSKKYVIVYSSNTDEEIEAPVPHVRHRKFTKWVDSNIPGWSMKKHIPNKYPYKPALQSGSFADFYIYEKESS